jgi:hypothetical protein
MSKMLQRAFTEYMGNKISDYCGLKKLEFSRYVFEQTNQIERNTSKYAASLILYLSFI